jgi:hypothetical protein
MDENETPDNYEVGYGKPPKHTRFQKGVSGNSKGRPKKAPDLHSMFMKESRSLIPINENGRRTRISKQEAVIKQLLNQAMTGNIRAARICFDICQQAQDGVALSAAQQASDRERYNDVRELTDEELMRIILASQEETERKRKK